MDGTEVGGGLHRRCGIVKRNTAVGSSWKQAIAVEVLTVLYGNQTTETAATHHGNINQMQKYPCTQTAKLILYRQRISSKFNSRDFNNTSISSTNDNRRDNTNRCIYEHKLWHNFSTVLNLVENYLRQK